MNLLQIAPLCDSRGKICYFLGAQIDVSGLIMEGAQMESFRNLQTQKEKIGTGGQIIKESKSEFQELSELLSPRELQNVREHGGNLFQPIINAHPNHRLFLQDSDTESEIYSPPQESQNPTPSPAPSLSLTGVYKKVWPSFSLDPDIYLEKRKTNENSTSTSWSVPTRLSESSSLPPPSKSQACSNPHS